MLKSVAPLLLLLALAEGFRPLPAIAQISDDSEITPFVGMRAGGSFRDDLTSTEMEIRPSAGFGLMLDLPWEENSKLEIYLSRQPTRVKSGNAAGGSPGFDLNVEYYHIGGTVTLEKIRDFDNYLVATIGVTRLDPEGGTLDPETRPSFSIGLGSKYLLSERIRLRIEGRAFATAMSSDSSIFCNLPGACEIKVKSDTLVQWEASLGLSFAF